MRLLASRAMGSSGWVEVSRWGSWLSASWRTQVVRGWQIRSNAARPVYVMGRELGRVAEMVRVPGLCSESVLDVQPAIDLVTRVSSGTARGLTLQPGSLILIRDTGVLRLEC